MYVPSEKRKHWNTHVTFQLSRSSQRDMVLNHLPYSIHRTWHALPGSQPLRTKVAVWCSMWLPPDPLSLAQCSMIRKIQSLAYLDREREHWNMHSAFRFHRGLTKELVSFWSVSECWWEIKKSRCLEAAENSKIKKKKFVEQCAAASEDPQYSRQTWKQRLCTP